MIFTPQRLSNSPSRLTLRFTRDRCLSSLPVILRRHLSNSSHFQILKLRPPLNTRHFNSVIADKQHFRLRVYDSEGVVQRDIVGDVNFDSFLSVAELLCLLSSVIASIGFAVSSVISASKKGALIGIGNRVYPWCIVLLVTGVAIGAWIRKRQWKRVCRETVKGGLGVNLLDRIEKLEEDLKSSTTIVRVLSRQLEKLGIRFRLTRKALKEPIAETAALAQKNSEATRALALQEDILEKELVEIQKVLLAMQEQQQKQLELILAIGKTTKLWENKGDSKEESIEKLNSSDYVLKQEETYLKF